MGGVCVGCALGCAHARSKIKRKKIRTPGAAVAEKAPNSEASGEGANPLPPGWEAFKNSKNEIYFVNKNTKENTKKDPRPLPTNWSEDIRENGDELERWFINSELSVYLNS